MKQPPIQQINYYKGNTLRTSFTFVDIIEGEPEPANLDLDTEVTYLAQVRLHPMSTPILATIGNDYFEIGNSDENTPNIKDQLIITCPPNILQSVPEGNWHMDVFRYYDGEADCLVITPINFIENVTKQ